MSWEQVKDALKERIEKGSGTAMDTKTMDLRAKIVKDRLLDITAGKHTEFLRTIGESEYDPFKYKTWHHLFKVHELDIEKRGRVKEKPVARRTQGIAEFLKESNVKDKMVKEALETVCADMGKEEERKKEDGSAPTSSSMLSESLLKKVISVPYTM